MLLGAPACPSARCLIEHALSQEHEALVVLVSAMQEVMLHDGALEVPARRVPVPWEVLRVGTNVGGEVGLPIAQLGAYHLSLSLCCSLIACTAVLVVPVPATPHRM